MAVIFGGTEFCTIKAGEQAVFLSISSIHYSPPNNYETVNLRLEGMFFSLILPSAMTNYPNNNLAFVSKRPLFILFPDFIGDHFPNIPYCFSSLVSIIICRIIFLSFFMCMLSCLFDLKINCFSIFSLILLIAFPLFFFLNWY